jgi:hypothetical protein
MTDATLPAPTTDDPPQEETDAREAAFALALAAKLEQGYRLESQGKTDAILFNNGRRRWFGLIAGPDADGRRQRIALEADGSISTRGL